MSLQRKLLPLFVLTVFLTVVPVTVIVSSVTRRAFEQAENERTAALVAQFRREFSRRGEEIAQQIGAIAASEAATRVVLSLGHGAPDYGALLNAARNIANDQQLDFLEFLDADGTILSSAQWPARFGYKETTFSATAPAGAFLQREELPEGATLGLVATRMTTVGDKTLYVTGGKKLASSFFTALDLPADSRALFYENVQGGFSPDHLLDPSGVFQHAELLAPLIQQVQQHNAEAGATIHWSGDARDDEAFHALPLSDENGRLLGILLVGNSRRQYVILQNHIRSAAIIAGAAGIVLAVFFSAWVARRVTRPVAQLAEAAREVSQGNWNVQVPPLSSDELGQLSEAFNRMTHEIAEQRERLVQSERVAAWRELARRLAHELKNPLFPLQLTVENLTRARQQTPEQFEEIFRESSSTLLAEIANLKSIISRFSEFSKMPQPRFQVVQVNEIVRNVARLLETQPGEHSNIQWNLELADSLRTIAADADLLHRALSNLVLNAIDEMPGGGRLTLRTAARGDAVIIEVSDTGRGLSKEECERLFTPYYTKKAQGTGLGLAIVQSIISDHGGKISVVSQPGQGATFTVELPRNMDKLPMAGEEAAMFRTIDL